MFFPQGFPPPGDCRTNFPHAAEKLPTDLSGRSANICSIVPAGRHNLSSRNKPVMHRPSILDPSRLDSPAMAQVAQIAQAPQSSQTAPVPPQNLDAEESVLGAMMLSPGAIGAVSEALDASDFYRESHAKIYRAALGLYAKGEPVDAITLVDELEERGDLEGVGGRVRIHELAALVPASANAGHYARIVREMATLRGLINAGSEISRLGWERPGEAADLLDKAEQGVFDLSQARVTGEVTDIDDPLQHTYQRITALYESCSDR